MFNDNLKIESELKPSWLIQRLQKPFVIKVAGKEVDNPFSFGGGLKNGGLSDGAMKHLRHIFEFDYMGAAEFEFGAVPAAIRFIAEQSGRNNVVADELHFKKDESVFYLCPKPYNEWVKDRINNLRTMKPHIQLKEYCGLKEYFDGSEYAKKNVGWLELDNGFAFFTDKEMFDKFCSLLGVRR